MSSLKDKVKEMEKGEIINALEECSWVMSRAARRLGITKRMIGYKIKKYNIKKGESAEDGEG
jgi:transcriptional regulator with GAF, ATPase, and Fis domain